MSYPYCKPETGIDPIWFKKDIWSHEEAACLINGTNPTPDTLHYYFNSIYLSENADGPVVKTRDIFAATAWTDSTTRSIGDGKRPREEYIEVAISKGIRISEDFTSKRDHAIKTQQAMTKKQPSSDQPIPISPHLFSTLKPLIDIIENFKNCPEFKRSGTGYGKEVQQKFIANWLKRTTNATDHEIELLKILITDYYDITSANKKYNLTTISDY